MKRLGLERTGLLLILIGYLILAVAYNVRTPAWQAPDEPAHYNYIAQIVADGCCPIIEPGDWDSAYLARLTSSHFAPEMLGQLDMLEYEDHQPPLYYLLASVIFRLTDGNITALRLFSTLLGGVAIVLTYGVGKALYPKRIPVALGAAAFVAFIPQHIAILSSINNDSLAEVVIAAAMLTAVLYLRYGRIPVWLIGVIVGLGLVTKVNTLLLVGVIPAGFVLRWWFARRHDSQPYPTGRLVRDILVFFVPVLLIASVWVTRNISVYGFPDVFGLGAHNAVVADQARTADLIAQIGIGNYFRRALETTFISFWGQFGWMELPLTGWMVAVILILIGIVMLGWIVSLIPAPRPATNSTTHAAVDDRRAVWGMLILLFIAAVTQYIYYNAEFWQLQGRYLYAGLIPLALAVSLGLDGWGRLLVGFDKSSGFRWWAQLPILVLIPLNLFLLWRVIPALAFVS